MPQVGHRPDEIERVLEAIIDEECTEMDVVDSMDSK